MRGCLLRGFARTSKEITKQRTIRMLWRTCWLRTKLWDAIWVWKSTFWRHIWIFSRKISAKSVTNTVKDFTKTFWLWKKGKKANGPQVYWQTIVGHWRGTYMYPTWRQIPAKVIKLYTLQESFCLFHKHVKYYFAHLNSSVPLKSRLMEKSCIHIWIQHKTYC